MEQSSNLVAMKDAPTMSSGEECVFGMGQKSEPAVMKDAPTMSRTEGCVKGMGQSEKLLAVTKKAPALPRKAKQRNSAGLPLRS